MEKKPKGELCQLRKGDIIIRLESMKDAEFNFPGAYQHYKGAIIEVTSNNYSDRGNPKYIYGEVSSPWRFATQDEIRAFNQGIENIKSMIKDNYVMY